MGQGFGLGFAVRMATGRNPLSPGEFFWAGSRGTYFCVDPKERMWTVFMMQAPQQRRRYFRLLRDLVYQAIVD
jgi:CubicO group peptidase (beta-lactamase class C family)